MRACSQKAHWKVPQFTRPVAGSPLNPADCLAGSPMPSRCAGAQISHWTPGEEWAQELRRRSLNALEALWLDGAFTFVDQR